MITNEIKKILEAGNIKNSQEYYTLLKLKFGEKGVIRNTYDCYAIEFKNFYVTIPAIPKIYEYRNIEFNKRNGKVADLSRDKFNKFDRFDATYLSCPIRFYTYDGVEHNNFKNLCVHYINNVCEFKKVDEDACIKLFDLNENEKMIISCIIENGKFEVNNKTFEDAESLTEYIKNFNEGE